MIASDPEELTPEWLTEALRTNVLSNATVTTAEVTPLGPGQGLIGSLFRVKLQYDDKERDAPTTLIAKLSARPGPIRDLATRFRMYERETHFYRELAGRVNLPTPKLYYANANEDGGLTLLIEDMAPAQAGDLMAGTTLQEIDRLLEPLATMHAEWWDSPALDELDWLPSLNDPVALEIASDVSGNAWDLFVANFGEHLPPKVRRIGDILGNDRSVLDRLSAAPRTLVHADLRINNLMFDESGALRAVLDWQSTVAARGPLDVARLFVNNLEPENRRLAEAELLPRYHRLLREKGVTGYSYRDCWEDYRLAIVNQFGQVIVLSSLLNIDEHLDEDLGPKTGTRLVVALLDLELLELFGEGSRVSQLLSRLRNLAGR